MEIFTRQIGMLILYFGIIQGLPSENEEKTENTRFDVLKKIPSLPEDIIEKIKEMDSKHQDFYSWLLWWSNSENYDPVLNIMMSINTYSVINGGVQLYSQRIFEYEAILEFESSLDLFLQKMRRMPDYFKQNPQKKEDNCY